MDRMNSDTAVQNVVYGRIKIIQKNKNKIKKIKIGDVAAEKERLHRALEESRTQLGYMQEKAIDEVGESGAAIIEAHKMLLEDISYIGIIEDIITEQQVNSEYAVVEATEKVAAIFANMSDEYFRERADDVRVVSEKLIDNLLGKEEKHLTWEGERILVADDLTASELIRFGRERIMAMVLTHGTAKSHVAILAGMMGIPVVTGYGVVQEKVMDGTEAVLYIDRKKLILNPTAQEKDEALQRIAEYEKKRALLLKYKGIEPVTGSGKKILLYANTGAPEETESAIENDAQGIGLFRSEFIFLGRSKAPDEEEQFRIYRKVAEEMQGRRVIIRTLDVGSDKEVSYLHMDEEYNPALGYRGIRISLKNPELFKTQLRALLRASAYGRICIMYPMIISTEELTAIGTIMEEVKEELRREKIPFKDVEEGIMIETPAAVMISDELAEMVDFFSIGTNDLIQYTLALDRQNEKLEEFMDPHHPAILRMIKMVADNAHKAGIWCGICGELASDLSLTERFLEMGIDELSVPPMSILPLKQTICEMK